MNRKPAKRTGETVGIATLSILSNKTRIRHPRALAKLHSLDRAIARSRPVALPRVAAPGVGGRSGRPKLRRRFWRSLRCERMLALSGRRSGGQVPWVDRPPHHATVPAAGNIIFSEVAVSQPSEPTPPSFSHDLTAKSIFAEPEAARDLVALLAARECPELQGWTPVRLVAGSAVTADPERRPPQSEGHRDLVWELARADDDGARMLLHLEFQSQRDAEMSERMFLYALHISPSLRGLEICGVVVNTGIDRFGEWRRPVQTVAGAHRYGFRAGALLEIHDHAVPGLPGGAHALPSDNLAAGFVALTRVQAEMTRGRREAAALVLAVLRAWILPRALGMSPSLRRALGAWFKTRFDELLADCPALRALLHGTYLH